MSREPNRFRIRAVVFDRDGTLIRHVPYLHDPRLVELLPSVARSLHRLQDAGFLLFLHTNQSGVGRGLFPMEDAHACNSQMIDLLDLGDLPFARICIAPEVPGAGEQYRKPSPRFAREIMKDFDLSPKEICYVGDRGSDLATAMAAGTRGLGVKTGLENLEEELVALGLNHHFVVCESLDEVTDHLLMQDS